MKPVYKVDGHLIHRAKELRAKGYTQMEIAVELKVSQGTISIILRALGLGGKLIKQPSPLTVLRRQAKV